MDFIIALFPSQLQISDLLGRDTALCNTIGMVKDAAQKTFFDILKTRGEKLLRYPPPVAIDLSPPPAVREGVSLTLEIIENYNSMMVSASGEKPAFDPVLSALLDPIIKVPNLRDKSLSIKSHDCALKMFF